MTDYKYNSQVGQDKWVLKNLNYKQNGVFIDIGSGHPVYINNTFLLEREFGWTGLSFDNGPVGGGVPVPKEMEPIKTEEQYINIWKSARATPLICQDALQVDYEEVFKENGLPMIIDYLSMDLEPPLVTYECLLKIPFEEYRFNVITFETDFYRQTQTREPSRELLNRHGYILKKESRQEDWWVHKSFMT